MWTLWDHGGAFAPLTTPPPGYRPGSVTALFRGFLRQINIKISQDLDILWLCHNMIQGELSFASCIHPLPVSTVIHEHIAIDLVGIGEARRDVLQALGPSMEIASAKKCKATPTCK